MAVAELYELSASELVAKLAARDISPVEVVRSLLARIERLEPELRAWATLDAEGALAAARACESAVEAGQGRRILSGLPVGVKDIYYTAGLKTSAGSPLLADFVPDYDAGPVARLREAGAIILGKTVTTQFADGDPSPTRNPWNPASTPGGSSSGSAAAVAARMVPAALGTQTAGSVLRPSAYCGVVGLKPTFGRISRSGVLPFAWSLDTMGVLVRSVSDAALLLQALAGFDPLDDGSLDHPTADYRAAANQQRAPRIGLLRDFMDRSEPEVRGHADLTARRLEREGADIREVRFPCDLDLALACQHVIQNSEASDLHAAKHAANPEAYAPRLRGAIEAGRLVPAAVYVRVQRWRRRISKAVEELFEGLDVLMLPTASNVAPDLSTTGDTSFQAVWTMLGVPTITLPSGLSAARLPFGIQLVGRAWDEAGLLASARWCEEAIGPARCPF